MEVKKGHFLHAALEIGQSGENDTLPYDIDAGFIRDKSEELSQICFELFQSIDSRSAKKAAAYVNEAHYRCRAVIGSLRVSRVSDNHQNPPILEPLSERARPSYCGGK